MQIMLVKRELIFRSILYSSYELAGSFNPCLIVLKQRCISFGCYEDKLCFYKLSQTLLALLTYDIQVVVIYNILDYVDEAVRFEQTPSPVNLAHNAIFQLLWFLFEILKHFKKDGSVAEFALGTIRVNLRHRIDRSSFRCFNHFLVFFAFWMLVCS